MTDLIPLQFLGVWGFRDDRLLPQAACNRARALEVEPLASFHIVTPSVAKDLASSLPENAQSLVMSALDSSELSWIQKADICKPLAVYTLGGFYYDLMDSYPIASVEPLRGAGIVLSKGWAESLCEADILAARKGDGRILDLLVQACSAALSTPQQTYTNRGVLQTTGPILWSRWAAGHRLTGRPIVNRFAQVASAADADEERGGQHWGIVTACAQPYFEVRHACSWMVGRKLLLRSRLNEMAGQNRLDVHGACSGWDKWNVANAVRDPDAEPVRALSAVDSVLDKILKLSKSATTLDDLRMMILRAMDKSFPGLAQITNVDALSKDMSKKGDQRKITLVTLLGQKKITEVQRSRLIGKLNLNKRIIREEKRSLIQTRGVLRPGVLRHLSHSGRGTNMKRLVKKPAAAAAAS